VTLVSRQRWVGIINSGGGGGGGERVFVCL
jgi:hypothetical protein